MTNHPNRKRSSNNTVTLIRRRSGFVNIPDAFQVMMPGAEIDEYNEEVQEYYLPDGYKVAKSVNDELEVYDTQNKHCEIVMHSTGRPQLVGEYREMPVLKRKPEAA